MSAPEDDRIDVRAGVDTDGDSVPDTLVYTEGELLRLAADTDRDGLADVIVEIGPDASVHTTGLAPGDWTIGAAAGLDAASELTD
ncbi:MAG: hypothetical protein ACR2GE_10375 [Pseudonocardia sp.]